MALVLSPEGGPLAVAAWACHLPVIGPDGRLFRPDDGAETAAALPSRDDQQADLRRSRNLVVGTRSLVALAAAIDERCPDLGAVGGMSPRRLWSGVVPVRSYRDRERSGFFDQIDGCGTMTPLEGATPFAANDGEQGLSIGEKGGEIIICLKHTGISHLRLLLRGTPNTVWIVQTNDGSLAVRIGEDGTAAVTLPVTDEPGPVRVRFVRDGDTPPKPLHVIGPSAIGQPVPTTPDWAEARFELVPAGAWPIAELQGDGDWQCAAGFLPIEPAVPQEGLYAPFHWSAGERCTIRLRVATAGARTLRMALSAGVRDQRVRLVVAGRIYDWCTPLAGPIGHVEHRSWLIDLPAGEIEVALELSDVLRAPGQELGIILFAVTLMPALG